MKLSLILQAIDRWSAPTEKAVASTKHLKAATDGATSSTRHLAGASVGVGSGMASLTQRLSGLSARLRHLVSGPASMAALEKVSYGAGYAIGRLGRAAAGVALNGLGYATAGLTGLLGYLTYGVIATGAKFEVFQAQLEGVEGTAAAAKASLAWVRKFAQETPYEVEEVTGAFVKMKKRGIDPLHGGLTAIGDAAAGANKNLDDTVEAISDAQNFQYDRLPEFNITASTKGNTVMFNYMTKAGKEASRTVHKTKLDIQRAMLDIYRGDVWGRHVAALQDAARHHQQPEGHVHELPVRRGAGRLLRESEEQAPGNPRLG